MNEEIIAQESDDIVNNVDSDNVFDNNENDVEEIVDDSEELELDGKVYKVPKAIKSSVMKNADYTQKTQELAREREAIARIREETQKHKENIKTNIQERGRLSAINDTLQQYEHINWGELADQDQLLATKLWMQKSQLKDAAIELQNKLNNEEGYIKTDDNFERYFRNELLTKFKMLIDGNKRNNLQNILQCLLSEYKESNNLSESENKYAMESLFGFEDNDNDSDIDRFPKKLLTLQRNILDLFMVNI
jgi:small-conductance mechanosensitive channel